MSFSLDPYPLLKHTSDAARAEAQTLSQDILQYMGNRYTKPGENKYAVAVGIISLVQRRSELVDEMYCQLMKQTTNNPSVTCTVAGWRLLAIACHFVAPTRNLETHLVGYMHFYWTSATADSFDARATVGGYAQLAKRALLGVIKAGTSELRMPSEAQMERISNAPFTHTIPVFGGTPEQLMEAQRAKHPAAVLPLPFLKLLDAFRANNGCTTEGVFRLSGSPSKVASLRNCLETDQPITPALGLSVHDIAAVLKQFFREMEEPLIGREICDYLLQIIDEPARVSDLVHRYLPPLRLSILNELIKLLREVSSPDNRKSSLMTVENLAIVWAPCLFSMGEGDVLTRAKKIAQLCQVVFSHF